MTYYMLQVEKLAVLYDHSVEPSVTPDGESIRRLLDSLANSMSKYGWWSPPLTRLSVALACVTGHYDLAIEFFRYSLFSDLFIQHVAK